MNFKIHLGLLGAAMLAGGCTHQSTDQPQSNSAPTADPTLDPRYPVTFPDSKQIQAAIKASVRPATTAGPTGQPKRTAHSTTKASAAKATDKAEEYPPVAPPSRSTVEAELQTAERLLSEATEYADGSELHRQQGIGTDFYDADNRFQASIDGVARTMNLHLARSGERLHEDAVTQDIINNLSQAEAFLHSTVVAALASCNSSDAHANLRVARADIREARRDFDGDIENPDGWEAPEIQETGSNECDQN